jgi:hypothetical protein
MFSINLLDYVFLPIYLGIIYYFAKKKLAQNTSSEYKYYLGGLFAKISGGLLVALIYEYYYQGGDTLNYFHSSVCMVNLAGKDFGAFLSLMSGDLSWEHISQFSRETGYPLYTRDDQAFAVVRFTVPFCIAGGKLFLPTTALVAWFCYSGLWRLYQCFAEQFPTQKKQLAYAILFVPSVLFWGSGILKDSYSLTAATWMVYCIYRLFSTNTFMLKYYVLFGLFSYLAIAMKPYIFLAVTAGVFVWIAFEWISRVRNRMLRLLAFPVFFGLVVGAGAFMMSRMGEYIGGHYADIDTMLERAVVVQSDLVREYYGENSFNIGEFDASLGSIAQKIPSATMAGLFRPYIWESRNILMVFSGIENLGLLLLCIYCLLRVGPVFILRQVVLHPYLLVFSFTFSLVFAFAVGLTTANFGALVRYKIPLIPFFVGGMFVLIGMHNERNLEKKKT